MGPEVDEVEMIMSQPLPADRKIQLLEDVRNRLGVRFRRLEDVLFELKGEL